MQMKPLSTLLGAVAALTLGLFSAVAQAAWPERPSP